MDERATKKIVVDPGHGGTDPGTTANGIVEKDLNLKISNYMTKRFKDLGLDASITRDKDETLDANVRPSRAQSFYGKGNDVIVVSNHINAGGGDGAEVIYALRNNSNLSQKIAKEIENSGQNVRKYYQRRLPSNPAKDYYYIHRDTPNNETVIVEYGFADSSGDDVNQLKNNWEQIAEGVVKAVTEYAGGKYIPISTDGYYIVKSGDTLWSIANKYGITVDELKKLNNLTNNSLSVGQTLVLPKKDETGIEPDVYYIVKSGDSLWSISKKYNLTVDELKRLNNLTSNLLSVGQKLKVKEETTVPDNVYIVQSGDSLWSISKKFNVTVDEIKKANNLTSNLLSINQKLTIPSGTSNITYIVKKGDSLYKLANTYNTTVDKIKAQNNLSSNLLSIGQKLIIPN